MRMILGRSDPIPEDIRSSTSQTTSSRAPEAAESRCSFVRPGDRRLARGLPTSVAGHPDALD